MFDAILLSLVIVQASPGPSSTPSGGTPIIRRAPAKLPIATDTATIANSGSTNFEGYQIAVEPNGAARWIVGGALHHGSVSPATAKELFTQLAAAGKLEALPVGHCMKSASFGTTIKVNWRRMTSPDLSCAIVGTAAQNLLKTVESIVAELKIQPGRAGLRHTL